MCEHRQCRIVVYLLMEINANREPEIDGIAPVLSRSVFQIRDDLRRAAIANAEAATNVFANTENATRASLKINHTDAMPTEAPRMDDLKHIGVSVDNVSQNYYDPSSYPREAAITPSAITKKPGLTWSHWAAIALGAALLIALIIVIVVVVRRATRKQKKSTDKTKRDDAKGLVPVQKSPGVLTPSALTVTPRLHEAAPAMLSHVGASQGPVVPTFHVARNKQASNHRTLKTKSKASAAKPLMTSDSIEVPMLPGSNAQNETSGTQPTALGGAFKNSDPHKSESGDSLMNRQVKESPTGGLRTIGHT